jgi:hypothetical protein
VFLGVELTLLIDLKKEMGQIEGGKVAILLMIEGVVSPAEEKKCNVKWKEELR